MRAPLPPRRTSALTCLVAALVLAPAGPAAAEELVVTITAEGVQPQVVVAQPGDTLRFVNEDPAFAYRAQSTGGPWTFDSGPTALLEDDFVVPTPLTSAATYTYRVAQDPPYRGTVLLGSAPSAAASPAGPSPAAAPPSAASPAASPASPAPPAVAGELPAPPSDRPLGLPTVLAGVLLLGAGSLLVRVLLAQPVPSRG